jgi:hypothetical protein
MSESDMPEFFDGVAECLQQHFGYENAAAHEMVRRYYKSLYNEALLSGEDACSRVDNDLIHAGPLSTALSAQYVLGLGGNRHSLDFLKWRKKFQEQYVASQRVVLR